MAMMLSALMSSASEMAAFIAFTLATIIAAFLLLVSPSSARAIALAVAVNCAIRLDAVDCAAASTRT